MLLNNLTGSNPLTWAPVQYADTPVMLGTSSNTWSPVVDNLIYCDAFYDGKPHPGCNPGSPWHLETLKDDLKNDNAVTCDSYGNCIVKDDLKLFDGVWLKKAVTDSKAWTSKAATDAANWTSDAAKTVADKSEKVYNAVTGKYDDIVLPTSSLMYEDGTVKDCKSNFWHECIKCPDGSFKQFYKNFRGL